MKATTIRSKIMLLAVIMVAVVLLTVAVIIPYKTKQLAGEIMHTSARFVSQLLAENLAQGMQVRELDEGAALQQTLAQMES
ncbi:MAG: hypothetical protein GF331_05505, partial [Chitinivibrionales bacterium]|nr:hypothetical protein [Chitinivibrionales bacterium]